MDPSPHPYVLWGAVAVVVDPVALARRPDEDLSDMATCRDVEPGARPRQIRRAVLELDRRIEVARPKRDSLVL